LEAREAKESSTSSIPLVVVTAKAFTGNPIALVAVERTGGSVGFPLHLVVAIVADEFENSCMDDSGVRSNCVFFDMN
jgi:hypothetical protein